MQRRRIPRTKIHAEPAPPTIFHGIRKHIPLPGTAQYRLRLRNFHNPSLQAAELKTKKGPLSGAALLIANHTGRAGGLPIMGPSKGLDHQQTTLSLAALQLFEPQNRRMMNVEANLWD